MPCNGICLKYRATKPRGGRGRYAAGQKRCQICEIFIKWDGRQCPCCNYRMRLLPRTSKNKAVCKREMAGT